MYMPQRNGWKKLILVGLLSCMAHAAAADSVAPLAAQQLMTHLLGAAPEARDVLPLTMHIQLSIPEIDVAHTVDTAGSGDVAYQLHGSLARVLGEALPAFVGAIPAIAHYVAETPLTIRGLQGSTFEVRWDTGRDVTIHGLALAADATSANTAAPARHHVEVHDIDLTTGAIVVAGHAARGTINLAEQRVTLVGSFHMPTTGDAHIDRAIAGKRVLMSLTVGLQTIK